MPSIKHILAPIDFSERSRGAVLQAAELAKRFGAKLTLMHVVPTVQTALTYRSPVEIAKSEKTQVEASRVLEAELKSIAAQLDPVADDVLAEGDAARCIKDFIAENGVDLLVMSTHGLGGFRRYLLGSLTSKLLHDLKTPIVTGAHLEVSEQHPITIGNIGCAIDLRDEAGSERILRWSADLAELTDAKLTVIHVPPTADSSLMFAADVRETILNQAATDMTALLARLNIAAEVVIETGDPMEVISKEVERKGCDVVVLGRTAKRGPFRIGHADGYAVIREVAVPVISV